MSGKVGRNSVSLANDTRPFVCEIFGGDNGVTITNSTLFADNADATFSLSNQPVDAAYSQLCSVEIGLAGLSDETADGEVSTTCDATVVDIETGKTKNLEPGGNYLLDVPMGQSVPQFSLDVAPGTVVVICGMFCSQVNTKSLAIVSTAANLIGIADVKACIAEALAEFDIPEPDGSAVFGVVDADGNIATPDGAVTAAVDGQGNALEPGDAVLNVFDGDGNYIGSKLCPAESTPVQESFGPGGAPLPGNTVGTITIALADGTTATIGAGDPVPANSLVNVVVDEVTGVPTCIPVNTIANLLFTGGAWCVTYCDGSEDIISSTERCSTVSSSFGASSFTSATANGDVIAGTELCVNVNRGKCPGIANIVYQHSWSRTGSSDPLSGGRWALLPQYSCDDGVTWQNLFTGGGDQGHGVLVQPHGVLHDVVPETFYNWNEQQFEDRFCCELEAGISSVCIRITMNNNQLDSGVTMVQNASTMDARTNVLGRC